MARLPALIGKMRDIRECIVDHSMYPQPQCFTDDQADAIRIHLDAIKTAVDRHLECYHDWAATLTAAALSMNPGRFAGRRIDTPDGGANLHYSNAIPAIDVQVDGLYGFSAITRFTHLLDIVTDVYAIAATSGMDRGRVIGSAVNRMQIIMQDPVAAVYLKDGMRKCVTSLFGDKPDNMFITVSTSSLTRGYVTLRQLSAKEHTSPTVSEKVECYMNGPLATASVTNGAIDYITGFVANRDKFTGIIQQIIPSLPKDSNITSFVTIIAWSP